jgi:hypothetical protein
LDLSDLPGLLDQLDLSDLPDLQDLPGLLDQSDLPDLLD